MKVCKKCGKVKQLESYYTVNGNKDGLSGKCKECAKLDVKLNYKKNIDHFKSYEKQRANLPHRIEARKAYQKTDSGKAAILKANKVYRRRYPNKYTAHNIVNNAIRDKKLFKDCCEVCLGSENIHAHHDDYLKPLNVRWLCAACRSQWHRDNGEAKNP